MKYSFLTKVSVYPIWVVQSFLAVEFDLNNYQLDKGRTFILPKHGAQGPYFTGVECSIKPSSGSSIQDQLFLQEHNIVHNFCSATDMKDAQRWANRTVLPLPWQI